MIPTDPGQPSENAVRILRRVVLPCVRALFRVRLDGLENLPDDRPFLLVANHNAGIGAAELASIAALWADAFQGKRRLAGFAHPLGFKVWPVTALHRSLGSIPSTYDAAYAALDEGVPILVFPGGDHETLRPVWQAHRVDFGGRKGFLRIARERGVPIVPLGIRGSHFTAPILLRSKALAWFFVLPRLLGVKRWGLTVLGVLVALAIALSPLSTWLRGLLIFSWLTSPLIFFPWIPWTIRMRVGEPIDPDELFDDADEALTRPLDVVERRIEALVRARS